MNGAPLLRAKHALVFGAGGSIGAAVAKEFAAEGAEVFLSGRTRSPVEDVAKDIEKAGGCAHIAELDALDDSAVNEYIKDITRQAGSIDNILDSTGPQARQNGK